MKMDILANRVLYRRFPKTLLPSPAQAFGQTTAAIVQQILRGTVYYR